MRARTIISTVLAIGGLALALVFLWQSDRVDRTYLSVRIIAYVAVLGALLVATSIGRARARRSGPTVRPGQPWVPQQQWPQQPWAPQQQWPQQQAWPAQQQPVPPTPQGWGQQPPPPPAPWGGGPARSTSLDDGPR